MEKLGGLAQVGKVARAATAPQVMVLFLVCDQVQAVAQVIPVGLLHQVVVLRAAVVPRK